MRFFSKSSGVVVKISEFDRTTEITETMYPIYNYAGNYIGYVENGAAVLCKNASVDPFNWE